MKLGSKAATESISSFFDRPSAVNIDASFYVNTIRTASNIRNVILWYKWLRFIVRDVYGSSSSGGGRGSDVGSGLFRLGSVDPSRHRLVVISSGGHVSYFFLLDDVKDETISCTLSILPSPSLTIASEQRL